MANKLEFLEKIWVTRADVFPGKRFKYDDIMQVEYLRSDLALDKEKVRELVRFLISHLTKHTAFNNNPTCPECQSICDHIKNLFPEGLGGENAKA